MLRYFESLPDDMLFREVWHSHNAEDIGLWIKSLRYPELFAQNVGFYHPLMYYGTKGYNHTTNWVTIPDGPRFVEGFRRVYNHYNCYTTLNRYTKDRALIQAEIEVTKARSLDYRRKKYYKEAEQFEERIRELDSMRPNDCYVDLAVDFDVDDDKPLRTLGDALQMAIRLSDYFSRHNVAHQVFFTGGRGFHVVVDFRVFEQTMAADNHLINRRMMWLLENELGEIHFDPAIYSSRRQFRLENTIHHSGFYKIPLLRKDLEAGVDHIKRLALKPRYIAPPEPKQNTYLAGLYAQAKRDAEQQARQKKTTGSEHLKELRAAKLSLKRKRGDRIIPPVPVGDLPHPPCVREMLALGIVNPKRATRNLVTLDLASYFKHIGRPLEDVLPLLEEHAVEVLGQFSHSGEREIRSSTQGAVKTAYARGYDFDCGLVKYRGFTCNDTCELFRKYHETAVNRNLIHTDELRTLPQEQTYGSIDDIRKMMFDSEKGVIPTKLDEMLLAKKHDTLLLVKAPAGAGKTTGMYNYIDTQHHLRCCWVGSQLALFENIPEDKRQTWKQIFGRHPDITKEDGTFIPANCMKADIAKKLRDKRLNVNKLLCQDCNYNGTCDYHLQFLDHEKHWFMQQPMFIHTAEHYVKDFDFVVMDEDIMSQFKENITIKLKDAKVVTRFVKIIVEEIKSVGAGNVAWFDEQLFRILWVLCELLEKECPARPVSGEILHGKMDSICQAQFGESIRDVMGRLTQKQYDIVDRLVFEVTDPSDKLPLNFVKDFLEILHFELFEREKGSNLSRIELHRVRKPKENEKSYLKLFFQAPCPKLSLPVIILDATGKPPIYEQIFGKKVDLFEPYFDYRNPVVQVYSMTGSFASLGNARHRQRVLDMVRHYLAEEPRSLVVAKEAMKKHIEPLLPPEAQFAYFYGTRGSNAFEELQQIIIVGMPCYPPEEVLTTASAFFYKLNLSTEIETVQRTFLGTKKAVNVLVYKDPLVQAIAEIGREDEIYQQANRIRLVNDGTKGVVLATNIPLPQLPTTELVSLNDIIGRKPQAAPTQRQDFLLTVFERQLAKLGFVCPNFTIAPFVQQRMKPSAELVAAMKKAGCLFRVDERMSRPTLFRDVEQIAVQLQLKSFPLATGQRGKPPAVYGRDNSAPDKALAFLQQGGII